MPDFEFWYDETNTYKAWITADTKEQALAMLSEVENGNISIEDLEGFQNSGKNYELLIDTNIEEVI
jgi:hypothetical protein